MSAKIFRAPPRNPPNVRCRTFGARTSSAGIRWRLMESTSKDAAGEMNETFPSVARATSKDADGLVRVLSRAFDEDPVHNYILRQDSKRARAFDIWFRVAFESLTLPHGEAWIAEDASGAALWIPPGKW